MSFRIGETHQEDESSERQWGKTSLEAVQEKLNAYHSSGERRELDDQSKIFHDMLQESQNSNVEMTRAVADVPSGGSDLWQNLEADPELKKAFNDAIQKKCHGRHAKKF